MLKKNRPDTPTVVGVRNVESHLGGRLIQTVVPAHPNDLFARDHHQRDAVVIVHIDEPLQVPLGNRGHGGKETQVDRLRRLLGVHELNTVGVARNNRADVRRRTVTQDNIGFPVLRVGDHVSSIVFSANDG